IARPETFPVRFRRANPYEALAQFIEPGHDSFAVEKQAAEITTHLERLLETRTLPLASDFQGASPWPARYQSVAPEVSRAEFDLTAHRFQEGLERWLASLGQVRGARFYVLPGHRVRYEMASSTSEGLAYRVGHWRQQWKDGRLARFEPLEETVVCAKRPFFED